MKMEDLQGFVEKMRSSMEKPLAEALGGISHEVESDSGGGLVHMAMNTLGKVTKIEIDPMLLDKDNVHHLEQLLIAAYNDVRTKFDDVLKTETLERMISNPPEGFDLQKSLEGVLKTIDI